MKKDNKSKRKVLPGMPDNPITIELGAGIRARLMNDFARYSDGSMMMAITSADVTVKGKKVGVIRGDCGAPAIQVIIYPDGDTTKSRSWYIGPDQLFAAVVAADEAYMKRLAENEK